MDFLKFINSNTVRNHLQELEYQPTAMEAAWIVYQCETLSLKEKYTAWREIIDTMPDCIFRCRFNRMTCCIARVIRMQQNRPLQKGCSLPNGRSLITRNGAFFSTRGIQIASAVLFLP